MPKPDSPNLHRRLGIILDERVLSAPLIVSRISDRAMISGGKLTEETVESIVAVFHEGVLTYPIRLVDEKRVTPRVAD